MTRFNHSGLLAVAAAAAMFAPAVSVADEADRRQAWFGDVHVHTSISFDAYIFGVRRTPDDAFRYALGETIRHANGYDIALKGGPLDFYAVTDHAEYLGVLPAMDDAASPMSQIDYAKDMFSPIREKITVAFGKVFQSITQGKPIQEMDDREVVRTAWAEVRSAADRYYVPGKFTTFAGYEYTAQPGYGNLHRVVLFKGERVADTPFGALDSLNPEKLWDWMDANRAKGIDSIAIPHNSNVANGLMFQLTDFDGNPITKDYAQTRMRNEPLVEISQVKGTSDTHPSLSPNDEWADFEIYNILLGTDIVGKTSGSYVREALQSGLLLEQTTGANPYQFGLIGSSDTHNAGGPVEEDHYFGKTGIPDGTPEARGTKPMAGAQAAKGAAATPFYRWSAAGLAGVWAERNNREDIFAAMRRKETFATSGPRIKVRLFAGFDYPKVIVTSADYAKIAYAKGVPMGGELHTAKRGAPAFLAHALKDAHSAGLQRLQIIRGWIENGERKEKIYDVACSKGKPDRRTHRCPDNGERIDTRNCKIRPRQAAAELKALWSDPDFDPKRRAFYYVRVLENPTCRWSTWEANLLKVAPRKDIPQTIQERAWSSPIWVGE